MRTLGKILFGVTAAAIVVAGSLLMGCGAGKDKNKQQNSNYSSNSDLGKSGNNSVKKGLENYLLDKTESRSIKTSSTETLTHEQIYPQQAGEGGNLESTQKISRAGVGNYVIPGIEAGSEERNLTLRVLEFKSPEDGEETVKSMILENPYLLLSQGNIFTIIQPSIKDSDSLSPKQKEIYDSIINSYVRRTGAELVLRGNEAEQRELKEIIGESSSDRTKSNNQNPEDSPNFNFSSNAPELNNQAGSSGTNAPAVNNNSTANSLEIKAHKELVDYLLIGKSEGINLLSIEDQEKSAGLSLEELRDRNLIHYYPFVYHNILEGNPFIANREDISKIRKREGPWELRNLVDSGEGCYFIPSEIRKQDIATIDIAVRLFNSVSGAEESISKGDGYTDRIDYLILKKDNAVIIINAKNQIGTPMQAALYTKSILNYMKRTNAEISAKSEEMRINLEGKLRNADFNF